MAQAYKPLPHASELWELFAYKPLTGELVWNNHSRYAAWKGRPVGTQYQNGYIVTELKTPLERRRYGNHRLVWAWVTGSDPGQLQVDHRDRIRSNNCFWNLRLATSGQNRVNKEKTGWTVTPAGRYKATCYLIGGGMEYLGTFDTPEEARAAHQAAVARNHGEFACTE